MGYLFLALALCAGLVKAYCGKQSSFAVKSSTDAISITTVRMLMCSVIGLFLAVAANGDPFSVSSGVILISLASGFMSACFTVSWLLAVSTSMYMMVEVFVAGGIIIPVIISNIFYGEAIGALDAIGILLLLIGIYFISVCDKDKAKKWSFKGVLLLVLCMISSGCVDVLQKIYIKQFPGENTLVFNFYVYVFAAALLILVNLAVHIGTRKNFIQSVKVVKPVWLYVVIMAVCLFLNSYFKTSAAEYLDAVLLYPVNQGLAMVLSSFMAVLLFKERINFKAAIGIALALVAVILINIS